MVAQENAAAGDSGWTLEANANHDLEGYGSRITLHPGDSLDVAVNVSASRAVTWKVYRMGWYGGARARKIGEGGPLVVNPQAPCVRRDDTMRVECSWPTTFSVAVPADALSGVYLIKLASTAGQSYVPFVVHDGRRADLVLNVNVTTWQAYNEFGGESLYYDASGKMPHGRAFEVSFDRPFQNDGGAGRFLDWEVNFIAFVEALGYDVTYTTAFDIEDDAAQLTAAHAFVSVANDEYWTRAEREAVQGARDQGVNLAFLGADQGLWRVRLQPSADGRPRRVIACYKADQDRDATAATQGPRLSTARFRDPPDAAPENAMVGVMYESWMLLAQPLVVQDPSHWALAGTGLQAGDALPGGVEGEFDTRFDNGAEPAGLQELARSPVVNAQGAPDWQTATSYTAASGAEVFAIGSIGWALGLGPTPYADPNVALITRNVLDRFVRGGTPGGPDPAGAPWLAAAAAPAVTGAWASSVSTVTPGLKGPGGVAVAADGTVYVAETLANTIRRVGTDGSVSVYAGTGVDGRSDGPGASARFRAPIGLAVGADGTLYVADSLNNVIRAVAPDAAHTVSTVAGQVQAGGAFADGPTAQAEFDRPVAVAVAGDGALLVADMHNHAIRRVDLGAGTVSTFAGSSAPGFADGPGAQARFDQPSGVTIAADGGVYVLDTFNDAIRRIAPDDAHTVTTIAGGTESAVPVDGAGAAARLVAQGGLAWLAGQVYFSDVGSRRVRAVEAGGTVRTVAGDGHIRLADGPGAAASFAVPLGLAAGPDGSLWVADSGNGALRRITP